MIKNALKLIFALIGGMAIGLVVASAGIALLTDMTVSELFGKMASEGAGLWKPVIVGVCLCSCKTHRITTGSRRLFPMP